MWTRALNVTSNVAGWFVVFGLHTLSLTFYSFFFNLSAHILSSNNTFDTKALWYLRGVSAGALYWACIL